jgi:hypothetical protein
MKRKAERTIFEMEGEEAAKTTSLSSETAVDGWGPRDNGLGAKRCELGYHASD